MSIKRNLKKDIILTIILAIGFIILLNVISKHQVKHGNYINDVDSGQIYLLNELPNNERLSPIQLMFITDDTYSANQWAIHNPGFYRVFTPQGVREVTSTVDLDMDVLEAWKYMQEEKINRRKVVVAIIDTGIDYLHPDLKDHIWINKGEIPDDGIDNDMNGYIDDIYGWDFYNDDSSVCHYKFDKKTGLNLSLPEDNDDHGTHIAGIIGAISDNKAGIAGISSKIDIELMVLKINGGSEGSGSISDAVDAVRYATMMGADICNISWGTSQYFPALEQAMKESDMLFVAAAGNMGTNNDNKPVYPASFMLDNLISVTFIDANGALTKLSNYGKESVEIAAPGTDILSTVVGSYQTLSGSSMAAPQVSAIASLLYSYGEYLYPSNVKKVLLQALKPISTLEGNVIYPGIPNAYEAMLAINNLIEDSTPPTITLDTIYDKENIIIPVKAEDKAGAGIRTIRWLSGERTVEDFNHGVAGIAAASQEASVYGTENNLIKVSKAGVYTVYASDYAGNESVLVYEVKDDVSPPTISSGYSVSEDYSIRTVTIRAYDSQSGVKRVKYLEGERKASDFLPADSGTEIKIEGSRGSFKVKKDGLYTLYAIDNRGNQIIKTIDVNTVLSKDLRLIRSEKTMELGENYNLITFVKPVDTTDIKVYTSSNDEVAKVNSKGKITALSEGVATITVRTNNGHKAVCRIVVKR